MVSHFGSHTLVQTNCVVMVWICTTTVNLSQLKMGLLKECNMIVTQRTDTAACSKRVGFLQKKTHVTPIPILQPIGYCQMCEPQGE